MMIESIIALIGIALLACFALIAWADSLYQAARQEQRSTRRG